MNNDNLKSLYQTLKDEGYEPPQYEQFEKDMQDEKNLQGVYQTLKDEGYEPPEYETFKKDMGFGSSPQPDYSGYSKEVVDRYNSSDNKAGNYKDLSQIAGEVEAEKRAAADKGMIGNMVDNVRNIVQENIAGSGAYVGNVIGRHVAAGQKTKAQPQQTGQGEQAAGQPQAQQESGDATSQELQAKPQQEQPQQPVRQPQPTVAYQDAGSRRVAPAERGSALYNRIYQAYEEADKKGINHIKAAQAAIEAARANGEISPEQDIDLDAIVRTAREDFYDNKSKETARQLMGVLPEGRPTRDDAIEALGNLYYSEKFQKEIDDALKKGTVIPNPNREVYVREYLLSNLSDMLQKERGYTANEARSIASQLFYKDEHIAREVDAHLQQDYDKMADAILSKYDTDNSAEQIWNQAEQKSRAEFGNYMESRGAFPDEVGQVVEGFATHLKYHDLKLMADAAWNRLGQKQNAIIKELSQVLKQRYPQATPEQITKAAKEWARQRSDERLFNLAVAKNAPQSETEFFFRKVFASNAITKLMEAAARAKAGTIGDWEARDKAEAEYGKGFGRQMVGGLGTAVGFALDPSLLIAGGAGKLATGGATTLLGKITSETAVRKFGTTLAGRLFGGVIGGAANFGTFESLNEALSQLRYGGELTVDEKTGHYSIKPYSAKAIGKQALHGVVMGGTIGAIAPLTGNVFGNLVKSTQSTAGKMAYRVGELGAGTVAEGTIFAVPDIASAYIDYNKYIQAVSDPKSKEYIADAREREKVIADLEKRRNTAMVDAWNGSMAVMMGFRLQRAVNSAPNVMRGLSKKPGSKAGFESRVRSILDGRNDLALTKDEKKELKDRGYSDLKELTEGYRYTTEAQQRHKKRVEDAKSKGYSEEMAEKIATEELPYTRFTQLMNDGSVSEAARAKMYYYLTGHVLPMSTVMGSSVTEENGGYTVQSIGANGVITSRTFDSRKKAEAELQRINRQAELNAIEIGERAYNDKYDKKRMYEACRHMSKETGAPTNKLYELMQRDPETMNDIETQWVDRIRKEYETIGIDGFETTEGVSMNDDGTFISGNVEQVKGLSTIRNEIKDEFGVDVDKAIGKEPNRRSEKEQKAVEEYANRLFADVKRKQEEAAEQGEAPISPDAPPTDSQISGLLASDDPRGGDDSFQQGYETTDEEGMQDARNRMEMTRQKIEDRFLQAERFLNDIDADPIGVLSWETLSDEDKQVVLDYINAKAVYDGMIQRVRDDIDMEVAQATAAIDNRVAPVSGGGDGMIHPATLKIDDRQVDIVGGRVVMTEDGTMVDAANSDKDIIIRDRETGKVEFVDAHDILNIGDVLDPEQLKREQSEAIISQRQQEAADKIDGTLSFAQGDTYQLPDEEGNVHTLIVGEDQGDGTISVYMDGREEPEVVSKAWLQQMQDDKNRARVEEAEAAVEPEVQEEVATESQQTEQEQQTEEPEVYEGATEVPEGTEGTMGTMGTEGTIGTEGAEMPEGAEGTEAPEPMPMRGAGENAEPDFLAVTPERGHRYLYDESGLPQKVADNMVKANLDAAEKELQKQTKAIEKLDNNPGTSVPRYQQKRKELDEKQQAAQAAKDYWTAVKGEQDKRDAAIVAERAAQEAAAREKAKADEEARQAEEIAKREEQEKLGSNNVSDVIKKKWQDAKKVEGFADEIILPNGEKVKGKYMLVESGAATPSHNPNAEFVRNEGFPVDENGQTVNDRDYEGDPDAQEITRRMGATYDSRALQSVPVVSADGIVLSGNGRTMAGELAAQNNTDGAYIDYLRQYSNLFGFTPEQIGEFTHPRVVFVPDSAMPYTTDTFAKFNERDTKGQSKTEKAVKMSKVVDDAVFGRITRAISGYDNINDFYNDAKATTEAVNELRKAGAIGQMDYAEMFDGDKLSNTGKDVLESVLIGKAFEGNPDVIRMMTKHKSIRQRVVSALAEITNNMQFGEDYALSKELSEAIKLTYDALEHDFKVGERVSPHARQQNLFTFDDGDTVADYTNATIMMLADVMNDAATDKEGKKVTLKKVMTLYNQRAQDSANGQADIFSGGVKSKEEILKEVLNLLQYGTEKEKRAALKSAAEQRKSAATRPDGEDEGVQQDGAVSRSDTGSEPVRVEGSVEPAPVEPEPTQPIKTTEWNGHKVGDRYLSPNGDGETAEIIGFDYTHAGENGMPEVLLRGYDKDGNLLGTEAVPPLVFEDNVRNLQKLEAEPSAVQTALAAAEAETNTEPTEAQKEAGNYKKGHVKIDGYDVTIENPKGSVRRGTDASGKQWEQEMQNTYGYIRGTEGVDGDHIDVFFSDDPSQGDVFVVDQVNKDGSFDEHKVMYGFPDIESARKAYLSNYEDGWQGLGAITPVSKEEFKKWIDSSHRKTKPFAEYSSVKPLGDTQLGENPPKSVGKAYQKEAGYSIEPTTYTNKKGKTTPMHLVTFGRELSKDEIRAGKELAKESRGWWDREKGGFMMRDEDSAKALAEALDNEEAVQDAQPLSVEDMATVTDQAEAEAAHSVKLSDHGMLVVGGVPRPSENNTADETTQRRKERAEQPKQEEPQAEAKEEPKQEEKKAKSKWVDEEDADRFEELKRRMREKLRGQMNMGADPEILAIGTEMAFYVIKHGAKKFRDFAKAMIDELGDAVRPYLKSFYNGARDLPEMEDVEKELTPYDEVRTFDVKNFDKEGAKDILATAEHVVKEQKAEKQAKEATSKLKERRNTERKDVESEMRERGLRKATEEDLEGNPWIYLPGTEKRERVMLLSRKTEQTDSPTHWSHPEISSVMLTDGKTYQLKDLWVEDEQAAPGEVQEDNKKTGKKESPFKKKTVSLQQQAEPDLFGGLFGEEDNNLKPTSNDTAGTDKAKGSSRQDGTVGSVPADRDRVLDTASTGRTDRGETARVSDEAGAVADGKRGELPSRGSQGGSTRVDNGASETGQPLPDGGRGVRDGATPDGRGHDNRPATATSDGVPSQTGAGSPGGRREQLVKRRVKATKQPEPKFTRNYLYPENASEIDNTTPQQRLKANVEALEIVRTLMQEGRQATAEEREVLGRYRGWGGVELGRSYSTRMMRQSFTDRWGAPTEQGKLLIRLADVIDALDPNGERGVLSAINHAALTSYYTPTGVARVMNRFAELAGFKGGSMLDPSMGNGIFEGTMSKAVQQRTMIHGVELDWLTGQIARYLYPDANVLVTGFQDAGTADNAYDVVMSNIPFGDFSVTDKAWKHDSSPVRKAAQNRIHNYFAVKMLDNTRPGGLCVIMTSNAILDTRGNQIIREHIADNAEVLGVVRLPDNTFKGAGTSVVTDVIFLRKYKDDTDRSTKRSDEKYLNNIERPFLTSGELQLVNPTDGKSYKVAVNGYFTKNKGMMIGDAKAGGQYRADQFGLGSDMSTDEIAAAMQKLVEKKIVGDRKGKLFDTHKTVREVKQAVSEAYKGDGSYISSGNIVEQDGKIGIVTSTKSKYGDVSNTFTEMPELNGKANRVRAMLPIRKAMKQVIDWQIQGVKESDLAQARAELQKAYDDFTKKFGRLNTKENDFLTEDIDGYTLRSLEQWKDGKFVGLSDIFTKNTIKPALDLSTAKTPQEAISLSLAEYGEINSAFMEDVLGESWAEQCGETLFKEPFATDSYLTADAYLSGDVKTKLEQAREAAKEDKTLERNVKALEAVQPKDIPFDEISIRMGARWIPAEIYTDFMYDMFGIRKNDWKGNKSGVEYMPEVDQYVVNVAPNELGGEADQWRTSRRSASEVFTAALQDKSLSVYDIVKEFGSEKKVLNKEETELLNGKIQDLRTAFEDWLSQNPEREEALMRLYNDKFNRTVLRKFDGSHLRVPGLMGKELRPHQKDAVWMLINNRGGIVDHIVGAGKTLVMQSAIMEMRRMGIAKKPMIIGLKATCAQIAKEFREAFPAARILAPTEKDFSKENRKKFMSQIALNDYDCVILSHDQYCMLPHTEEVERGVIDEQMAQLDAAIEFLYGQNDKSQLTKKQIKGLEKRKANLEAKLASLLDRKIDREFTFEGLGVDYLFVDECQHFKSLPYVSTYDRVAGLGDKKGSQRAIALLNGVRYLQKMHQGDRGTVFLSGTTISNSLSEIYHLLNYLRPSEMQKLGMTTFDAWAGNYAIHTAELEYGVTNELKEKDRFRSLTNIPELSKMYAEIADVRNDMNLELPKPKMRSHIVTVPQSDLMTEINAEIVNMVRNKDGHYFGIESKDTTPWGLLASTLSAKAAINPRLIDDAYEDEGGKIPAVCEQVKKIYDQFKEQKGTQLIFCDTGVSSKGKKYDAYSDIINRLVNDYGIPRSEIADIHIANTDEKRKALFAKVNEGSVRILIGGTKNMGTGVNVQKRIVAMHHVDVPWTPADREQREGRGVRQGNEIARDFNDNNVDVYFYATEGSLDMYKYQLQETKGKLFAQFKSGTIGERTFDEGDAEGDFDPAEVVAMLSGNPVIFEKSKQDKKVEKLRRAKRAYESDWQRRRSRYEELQTKKRNIERLLSLNSSDVRDLERGGFTPDEEGKYPATVTVSIKDDYASRRNFDKPKEAGEYIHSLLKQGKKVQLSGFNQKANVSIPITDAGLFGKPVAELDSYGGIKYSVEVSDDDTAAGVAFRNLLQKVYSNRKVYERNLEEIDNQLKGADPGENKFPKQAELDEALKEKRRLDDEYKKLSDEKPKADEDSEDTDERFRDEEDNSIEAVNDKFNEELQQQIDGTLPKGHVYDMGMPGDILLSAGFPNVPIELSASHLSDKANAAHHPFDIGEMKDLVKALQSPIAVFAYGDKEKSQNVIVEIQHDGKNFVVGIHFNQLRHGAVVSDIRGLYPKENAEWLNWINQGKLLYADKEKIQTLIDKQRRTLAEVEYLDLNSAAKIIENFENPSIEDDIFAENGDLFREVEDAEIIEQLEREPKVKVYRAMQLIDGELYPPMSAKVDGEMRKPTRLGVWEEAEERPDLADVNGYFKLDKGNKKSLKARYNPYIHTSRTMLNDQFSEAQNRDNLVVVEMEVPASELTSGYQAEKAKDSVGAKQWKAGVIQGQLSGTREVILSRWAKPVRIVPVEEVADHIVEELGGQVPVMPSNVVTPQQREALEARGIQFVETNSSGKIVEGDDAGKTWKSVYGKKRASGMREREGEEVATQSQQTGRQAGNAGRSRSAAEERQRAEYAQRQWRRAHEVADEWVDKLGIGEETTVYDSIDDVPGSENFSKRKRKAKGWFDVKTGKIVIILGNHRSPADVLKTILHEAVSHYGLRKLFGKHFDNFLDNVYHFADFDVKMRISAKQAKLQQRGKNSKRSEEEWRRLATEEYLSELAESTDFENAEKRTWLGHWMRKIKELFFDMLHKLGLKNLGGGDTSQYEGTITDNELRYILWRSYKNMTEPGRYRNPFAVAENTAMEHKLKVGEFEEGATIISMKGRSRIEDEVPVSITTRRDELNIIGKVAELSKQEAKKAYERINSQMLDEDGLDLDEHFEKTKQQWIAEHGLSGLGKQQADELQKAMDKYGSGMVVLRWELLDRLEALGVDMAHEDSLRFNDAEGEGVDAGEDDPDAEGYDAGKKTFEESITEGLVQLAQQNRDNVQLRINAMRNIGGNLAKLRQAMARQREYDRSTVDGIVRLAKMVIDSGFFKDLPIYDVKRLMGMVNRAAGKEDITKQAGEVVDMLLQRQIKDLANILYDQMKVKGSKVNAKGVEVQGQLDLDGQRMVAAMKDAMGLDENSIAQRLGDINDKMGSDDATIAANAAVEYQGVMLAKQYLDEIKASEIEEKNLRHELKESHETTSERDRHTDSYRQYVASVQDAIRENRLERIAAYGRLIGNLGTGIKESVERAQAWREREQQRVNEIHHNANSDLEGVPTDEHSKLTWAERSANWEAVRFFMKPLATFDTLLRYFGSKSVDGKGYLWNRFMGGWVKANDKEWRSLKAAHKILDDKVSEIMGRKMRWSDLFAMERKMPTVEIAFKDGDGEKYHELTQGNLLYIYMVNKMSDGRMKLRRMGIDEEDVEFITEKIDPRFIQLADWIQDVFLKEKRNEYNPVHERLFGASMAAIENYFPLKVNDRSRGKEEDVEDYLSDEKIVGSTITGSIIKRVRNSLPLDVTGADAFDVVLEHLQKMEHWAAFAELNRDLNALLSYKRFRNRVLNMSSARYGAGKTLWENFKESCAIASGVYRPKVKRDSLDSTAVNVAKGVTAAKIAFRIYTAFKQLMSYPAYFSEASIVELAKSSNPVGAARAWNWAIEQLPGFAERWQSRQAGDSRLRESDADWGLWKNKIIETASRWGMSPNAFVDGLTVAMGAKAIYETKMRRYKDDGYSDEDAKKLALRDASVAYNETQQSSGNAYLSSMQLDRTVASVAFTVFRNASMGYQRRMVSALSNLKRKLKPGYRAESIEFMAKQMLRDGLDEEQAASAARRAYNRSWFRDIADTLIFGFVLQLTWNLAPYIPYLLLGDDDDEKDKMLEDATLHALAGGVEGLTGGNVMSDLYNLARSGEGVGNYNFNLLPLMSDLQTTLRHFKNDEVMAANDIINLLVQSSIGVNPQTITDAYVAIMDAAEGDLSTGKEIAMMLMRLGQVPQTQLDNLYIDELGMSAKEAKGHSLEDLAKRYATYKRRKNAPLTGILYDDTERAAAEERYIKRFEEKVKERISGLSDEALGMNYDRSDAMLKKELGKEAAKRLGGKDSYGNPSTDYGEIYLRKRSYIDLAEDVLLQTEESKAKAAGNDDRTKEVSSARGEITSIKKELRDATSAQEIEDIMERLRQRRRELMQELGIVK